MPVSLHVQLERPPAISYGTPPATRFVGLNASGADNRSLSLVTVTGFMALRFSHCLRFPENPTRTNENTSDSAAQSSDDHRRRRRLPLNPLNIFRPVCQPITMFESSTCD